MSEYLKTSSQEVQVPYTHSSLNNLSPPNLPSSSTAPPDPTSADILAEAFDEDAATPVDFASVPVDSTTSAMASDSVLPSPSSSSVTSFSKSSRATSDSSRASNTSRQKLYTPQELVMNPQARNLTLAQQLEIVKRYPSRQTQGSMDVHEDIMPFSPSVGSVTSTNSSESYFSATSKNSGVGAPNYTVIPIPAMQPALPPTCCRQHTCLQYYWQQGLFAHDYTNRFTYESTLAHQFTPRFLKLRQNSGTLSNGRVYVAVSERGTEPMLGLFAGADIKKGEVVTMYGGSRRLADAIKAEPTEHVSHTRHVPASMDALDGRPYSLMFDRNSIDMYSERLKNPECRTKLFPKFWDEETLRICVDSGVGYMTNTDDKSKHNVKIVDCDVTKVGALYRELFLVATRDIYKDEEIISPYNNRDPAVKRTMEMLKQKKVASKTIQEDLVDNDGVEMTWEKNVQENLQLDSGNGVPVIISEENSPLSALAEKRRMRDEQGCEKEDIDVSSKRARMDDHLNSLNSE